MGTGSAPMGPEPAGTGWDEDWEVNPAIPEGSDPRAMRTATAATAIKPSDGPKPARRGEVGERPIVLGFNIAYWTPMIHWAN